MQAKKLDRKLSLVAGIYNVSRALNGHGDFWNHEIFLLQQSLLELKPEHGSLEHTWRST